MASSSLSNVFSDRGYASHQFHGPLTSAGGLSRFPISFLLLFVMDETMGKLAEPPMGKLAEPPVGKLTPFMIFYLEQRDAVKNRLIRPHSRHHHHYRPEDISKEITRLWRSLDFQRVKEYCMLSNLYAESVEKCGSVKSGSSSTDSSNSSTATASSTSANPGGGGNRHRIGKPRRNKDTRLPKPPVSIYMLFSRHHRAILKNEHPELSSCEVGKTIGALWKAATVLEKQPFDDLAAEDKTRYARELVEYRQWFVRTQGSKKREDEELSAASTAEAPVTSTKGVTSIAAETASTATVEGATTTPTAEASIATMTVATLPASFGQDSNPIASGQTAEEAVAASDSTPSSLTGTFGSLPLPMDTSPAEESLPTLPQKRNVAETATIEVSWSATPLTPSSQHQESSSQTTAKHAPCAKRQRVEGIPSSAAGLVANMASNVAMSPETLPLRTSERGEARVSPKAMPTFSEAVLDVGVGNGFATSPTQQQEVCDRIGNRPEHVGIVASGS